MNDFYISPAAEKDIDDIMRIELNGFKPEIQESKETFLSRIRVCPRSFLLFKTRNPSDNSEQTVGYLCAELMGSVPLDAATLQLGHFPGKQNQDLPFLYISSFSILPEFRGNGNGKLLWNMSIEYFKTNFPNCKNFLLLVNSIWQGARHIYTTSGFREINTFSSFFPDGDGILMQLKI